MPALEIAAALAKLSIGDRPLLMKPDKPRPARTSDSRRTGPDSREDRREPRRGRTQSRPPDKDKERFRIEVGFEHGVKPGNIVGAIANEAGLDGEHIGHIDIHTAFSLVDLPVGMPDEVFRDLRKVRVCGQALNISRPDTAATGKKDGPAPGSGKKGHGKAKGKRKAGGKPAPGKKARGKPGAKKGAKKTKKPAR